jgi:hypothetical protein
MRYIKKLLNSIKRNGLIGTFKKVIRFLKYKIQVKFKKNQRKDLFSFINLIQYQNVIVFENNFGWNKIMKQRPQQIAGSFNNDTLFIYHSHEDEDYGKSKNRIKIIKENLILVDLGYYRDDILSLLSGFNNKYLMIYSTDYIPYDRIKLYMDNGYQVIYEYVDDFNVDLNGPEMYKLLVNRHKQLLKDNPFVVCTANELYNKCLKDKFKSVTLVSNGVDYNHFKTNKNIIPKDLIDIRNKYKTIICYYGALASWFDYDLINKVAENKEYAVVLLGQDYDGSLNESKILDNDNVYYLGKKDYDELPLYGYNSDLFIIPFVINSITKATSPVKIFEYMAMGKPIITTALPECKKYESVLYSKNHDEFIKNLSKASKLENDKKYLSTLDKEARENTWESKAKNIIDYVNKKREELLKEQIKNILKREKYERIVVWRSPFGWNVPLFQRPQHIARQLSKQKCLVFYEVTTKTDVVNTIKKQEDNLYLVNFENPLVYEEINIVLKNIKKPKYLQIYSTNWSMDLKELELYKKNGFKVLYEYIDEISPELAGTEEIPKYIMDKYNYAIKNKDVLIVTTATSLYEDVKSKRGNINLTFSCNGVDYDFYQKIDRNYKFENNFKSIINNGKINVCYYGALASWFDYELIKKINNTNEFNIILFGIKYDDSYDNSGIDKLKNVHFMGARDYSVLKNYASKMDVLTIPFVINSITQATSPLKLFEYMALHKPIVTSAMNECKNYKSVMIANNHEEFIDILRNTPKLNKDKKYKELLDKEGKENDWGKKAEAIIKLLKESEKKKNGKN